MEEIIRQDDNLIIQENKVEIKKEPEDNGEKSQNLSNILNRMVQYGDEIFVPVHDKKKEPNNIEKIKKEKHKAQDTAKNLFDNHEQNLDDLYCEKCSLQFDKKYEYDLHLTLAHEQEIKVKKEPKTCKENFEELQQSEIVFSDHISHDVDKSKQNLKPPIDSIQEGKKAVQCNICGASFSKIATFKKHILSDHISHVLHLAQVHEQEIKVKMDPTIIEEHFEELQHRKKLLSGDISNVVDKSFQCDKCNSFFKSKWNLKRHIESVHEKKLLLNLQNCLKKRTPR